jgi:hypothetical protein
MNDHVRLLDGEAVEIPEFTRDVAGHVVDLRKEKWRLNSTTSHHTLLDWTKLIDCDVDSVAALRVHIVRLIETNGTAHVANAFRVISKFLAALRDDRPAPIASLPNLMWHFEQLRVKNGLAGSFTISSNGTSAAPTDSLKASTTKSSSLSKSCQLAETPKGSPFCRQIQKWGR